MKNLKSEKGVITMLTLITILIMLSFLITSYVLASNKVKAQKEILSETRQIYEPKVTMEEIYNSYINRDVVIPIYAKEQLLKIGNGETVNINGKYYQFTNENTTYVLMDDIEFDASEENLTTDWIRPDKNANFKGIFDWNGHTIEVTTLNKNIQLEFKETTITTINKDNLQGQVSTAIQTAANQGKISKVIKETINGKETIAVVPMGYKVSNEKREKTISGGLVITDGENEFVWIPTSGFKSEYSVTNSEGVFREPRKLWDNYETQDILNKYYGTNYYNLNTNFNYSSHYAEMVTSTNTYNGFYVGRYETTIEGVTVGSKNNAPILVANYILKEGQNSNDSNTPFYCRWWGLYDLQRKSSAIGNGNYVQTNMIWGQQWDAMASFLGDKSTTILEETHSEIFKSGQATYSGEKDVMKNIYDLRKNVYELTGENKYDTSNSSDVHRIARGDANLWAHEGGMARRDDWVPHDKYANFGSRLVLYIK